MHTYSVQNALELKIQHHSNPVRGFSCWFLSSGGPVQLRSCARSWYQISCKLTSSLWSVSPPGTQRLWKEIILKEEAICSRQNPDISRKGQSLPKDQAPFIAQPTAHLHCQTKQKLTPKVLSSTQAWTDNSARGVLVQETLLQLKEELETVRAMHYSAPFCSDDLFSSAAVLQKVNRFLPIILLSLSSNPSVSHLQYRLVVCLLTQVTLPSDAILIPLKTDETPDLPKQI